MCTHGRSSVVSGRRPYMVLRSRSSPNVAAVGHWEQARRISSRVNCITRLVSGQYAPASARRSTAAWKTRSVRSSSVLMMVSLSHLISVSYTHLRAHETRHDLVCRLLLEKKKYTTDTFIH